VFTFWNLSPELNCTVALTEIFWTQIFLHFGQFHFCNRDICDKRLANQTAITDSINVEWIYKECKACFSSDLAMYFCIILLWSAIASPRKVNSCSIDENVLIKYSYELIYRWNGAAELSHSEPVNEDVVRCRISWTFSLNKRYLCIWNFTWRCDVTRKPLWRDCNLWKHFKCQFSCCFFQRKYTKIRI